MAVLQVKKQRTIAPVKKWPKMMMKVKEHTTIIVRIEDLIWF